MIKYKGDTSKILSDISLEFGNVVDLQTSEGILKGFFEKILEGNPLEMQIEILCCLPQYLKPFCERTKERKEIEHALFESRRIAKTVESIFKVIEKYVSPNSLTILYTCTPQYLYAQPQREKKEIYRAA